MTNRIAAGWLAASVCGLAVASVALSAPAPKPKADPDSEQVEPAVDPAKVAGDPALRVADARNRKVSSNNLKQLGLAFHGHESTHAHFPADVMDKDGKPLLSWRVLLLPYLEEDKLYKEFKLDEPWDSENNKKLIERMPKVFQSPRVITKNKGFTVYQGFSGNDTLYRPGQPGMKILTITDGTSNTLMAVESSTAVPWTKPADVAVDPKKPLPEFGKAFGDLPMAVMCDGSVRTLNLKKLTPETLRGAITPMGGEVLGEDWNN